MNASGATSPGHLDAANSPSLRHTAEQIQQIIETESRRAAKAAFDSCSAQYAELHADFVKLKSENAKLRELLTVSQADADRTKSELLKLQTQITSIGSSLNCAGIRVQGCVKLDQKWENILKNALRHQYQLKDARDHEEGISDKEMEEAEKMLREFFPGDPEEVVWEFPDLYQMFLRIQGFLRAGNAAVDFWQAKASKSQPNSDSNSGPSEPKSPVLGLSTTSSLLQEPYAHLQPTFGGDHSVVPSQFTSSMTATSVMFSTIVPDTVMADQHYFQPFENSPPEHDMTLSGDIDAIEDILSRHQNVSVNMDDLTLHPGSEDHPMDMDIPTTEFETNRDDLIREGERRREMSTTPTPPLSGSHHSSHSHHPNSPSASPSPNLTSRCDTKSGSSPPTPNYEPPPTFREWETFPHYISTPPKQTPIKLPIPQPPFATRTGEFKVCFISMGGTAEQDTFCVKTISSTKMDYVETVFSSLVGP